LDLVSAPRSNGGTAARHLRLSLHRSRKTALFLTAQAVTPVVLRSLTSHLWLAVTVVAIATGAHQGWSADRYTLASDMFPRAAVGSVVGFLPAWREQSVLCWLLKLLAISRNSPAPMRWCF
jgi:hypothetical protein